MNCKKYYVDQSKVLKGVINLFMALMAIYWGFEIVDGEKNTVGGIVFLVVGAVTTFLFIIYVKEIYHLIINRGEERDENMPSRTKCFLHVASTGIILFVFIYGGYSLLVGNKSLVGYAITALSLLLVYKIFRRVIKKRGKDWL